MPDLLTAAALFFAGLIFLIKGSEAFVESAAKIARMLGVSDLVIGLTLVAVGTSLPELFIGIVSSYTGHSQIVIGNVLGSNIINLTLLLGLSALIAPIPTQKGILYRDGLSLLVYIALFYYFALDGTIDAIEGVLLLLLFILYSFFVFESAHGSNPDSPQRSLAIMAGIIWGVMKVGTQVGLFPLRVIGTDGRLKRINGELRKVRELAERAAKLRELATVVISGAAIYLGADWLVRGAVDIAGVLGVGPSVIGITIVSVGTTMPELMVSIQASRKRLSQMVIGNLIGSNITNITLIVGVAALINPLSIGLTSAMRDTNLGSVIPFMMFVSAVCVGLLRSRWIVTRKEGILLLLLYAGFLTWLLSTPAIIID